MGQPLVEMSIVHSPQSTDKNVCTTVFRVNVHNASIIRCMAGSGAWIEEWWKVSSK